MGESADHVVRLVRSSMPPLGPLPGILRAGGDQDISRAEMPNGTGAWVVREHDLARRVLVDPRLSRAAATGPGSPKLGSGRPSPDSIISLDGTAHARLRRLVSDAFTERRVAELRPYVRGLVGDLLDGMRSQAGPVDIVSSLAEPLPLRVLCEVLGIPWQDHDQFGPWVTVLFEMQGDEEDNRLRTLRLVRYVTSVVARKRRSDGDDLICRLSRQSPDGDRLSNRELVTLVLSLLTAGYETTANQLSLCILSVLSSAELAALLRADPSLTPVAVAEIMRLSPALSVMFPRVAVERMSIAGRTVEAGDPVLVSVVDANRRRREATARHFTFGHGVHRCIGAPLARLQLTEALHGLVERFPAAEPAEDPSALAWKAGQASRGLSRLYVNLAPTAR